MSELISNLLDKEFSQSDLDEFLAQSKSDPQLVGRWQRYHLAQGLLNGDLDDHCAKVDVADKVMAQLKADNLKQTESTNVVAFPNKVNAEKSNWMPSAIAASLLLGVFVMMQQQPTFKQAIPQLAQIDSQGPTENLPQAAKMPNWQTNDAAIEDALNALLVEHSEFTSAAGMNGLGSYSKVVSYTKL